MTIGNGILTPEAIALWDKRALALEAGQCLLEEKPDPMSWTVEDKRLWRYAQAISNRLDKLN